jgi:autotransporter-associated beta strand protein
MDFAIGFASNLGMASRDAGNLILGNATLQYTGGDASTDRAFTILAGKTATLDITTKHLAMAGATAATTGGLAKAGVGTLTLTGTNAYSGATTVAAGTLALAAGGTIANSSSVTLAAGAVLDTTAKASFAMPAAPKTFTFHLDGTASGSCGRIQANGLDISTAAVVFSIDNSLDDPVYVLADYASLTGSAFASAAYLPPGYTLDYAYNGGTQIALVSGNATSPYGTWASSKGLDGTAGKEQGAGDDPDMDGCSNLAEFAFSGEPLAGSDLGKVFVLTADNDTSRKLILTLAVRAGTPAFSADDSPTASHDGITYTIQGSTTLDNSTKVNVLASPVSTGLPAAGDGYEYRSFSLDGSNGLTEKGFLRAKVTK